MARRILRSLAMILSVPFVMVAVAFGWRPGRTQDPDDETIEPTGLSDEDAAHVAILKFSAWLDRSEGPEPERVTRLARHLLHADVATLAVGPLSGVLACADARDASLASIRRRALGLSLVAWHRSGAGDAHALELGHLCLSVGLNTPTAALAPRFIAEPSVRTGIA